MSLKTAGLTVYVCLAVAFLVFLARYGSGERGSAFGLMVIAAFCGYWLVGICFDRREARMLPGRVARWAEPSLPTSAALPPPLPYTAPETWSLIRDLQPAGNDVLALAILQLVASGSARLHPVAEGSGRRNANLILATAAPLPASPSLRFIAEMTSPVTHHVALKQLVKDVRVRFVTLRGFADQVVIPTLTADGLCTGIPRREIWHGRPVVRWTLTERGREVQQSVRQRVAQTFLALRAGSRYAGRDGRKDLFAAVLALTAGPAALDGEPHVLGTVTAAAVHPESASEAGTGFEFDLDIGALLDRFDERYRQVAEVLGSSSGGSDSGDSIDGDGGDGGD